MVSADNAAGSAGLPPEDRPVKSGLEILVPGKNWEYVAAYPLAALKPHPQQQALFVGISESGLDELAADIQARGLQNPLEILPDGTLVNGHQRLRACQKLGWRQLPVYLRHDLGELPESAVQEHIVQDNLQRKQLHPLEIARCYWTLREVYRRRQTAGDRPRFTLADIRRAMTLRFKISGRTLDRYLTALKAPQFFQDACIEGRLPLNTVCKLGALSQKKQAEMAARIDHGENLMAMITEYTRPRRSERDRAVKALQALARQIQRSLPDLEGRLEHLPYHDTDVQACRPVLQEAWDLILGLLRCFDKPPLTETGNFHTPDSAKSR